MTKFAVIFDMDGVLIDSVSINRDSFDAILAERELSMATVEARSGKDHKGGSLRDLLAEINQNFGVRFDFDDFSKRAGEIQFIKLSKLPKNEQLFHLLDSLKLENVPMAVATSSVRWRASKILEALEIEKYFNEVVAADDVKEHKPNPHLFLEAAKRLEMPPNRCVVIEDATAGVEAGKVAGMAVVGFEQFNTVKGLLAGVDLAVESFGELSPQVLSEIVNRNRLR